MSIRRPALLMSVLLLCTPSLAAKWDPISSDLSAIDDCPTEPGCSAAILLLESVFDSEGAHTKLTDHVVLRVFKPDGLDAATIKIPFIVGSWNIRDVEARSVAPDGSEVRLDPSTAVEETVSRRRGRWIKQLSFEIPGAQVGGYLEYRYEINVDVRLGYYDWPVQGDLPVINASISLIPGPGLELQPHPIQLGPARLSRDTDPKGHQRVWVRGVPALADEPLMPPEEAVQGRLILFPVEPWWNLRTVGDERHEEVEKYFKRSSKAKKLAKEVIGDAAPEEALERLYAWIQDNIGNTSYTESAEGEADSETNNLYVDDVLNNGRGDAWDLGRLFVFLARQAGFEAEIALVSTREDEFFRPDTFVPSDLNNELPVVRIDGEWRFFDPGTRYCPANAVSWENQGVDMNAVITRDGAGFLRQVPTNRADDNLLRREATITVGEQGDAEVELTLEAHGLAAVEMRNDLDHATEADRKKWFKEDLEDAFHVLTVETVEISNLKTWTEPLQIHLRFTAPGWAQAAGSRLLLPAAPLLGHPTNPLLADSRQNPIYYRRTMRIQDEVTYRIPEGYEVESLPSRRTKDVGAMRYEAEFEELDGAVRASRDFKVDTLLIEPKLYGTVQGVYKTAAHVDTSQIVLRRGGEPEEGS